MTALQNPLGQQLRLALPETSVPTPNDQHTRFNDPAFAGNKNLAIHRWVPWIAGFSSDFVRDVLNRYLKHKGVVLDPFCGVGTTLVESLLLGHNAYGFEINPYAALASRVKTGAYGVKVDELRRQISRFKEFYREKVTSSYAPQSAPPKGFRTRSRFYSPKVLRKVLVLNDFINTVKDPKIRDLFRLAFGSTMVSYSNYSYEPSLGRRAATGKGEVYDFDVGRIIATKLTEMAQDVDWLQSHMPDATPKIRTVNDSFFRHRKYLARESVDLIITSPPYLNNYHYNRNTRPQLYWLGYAGRPGDLKKLEESNFGKYWQTVRDQETVALKFSLPNSDLSERLDALRRLKPERGIYGGHGWANYAASYFNDCHRFAEGIRYVLRSGGAALIVIGNSILQGLSIRTDRYFGAIAESVGLRLVKIEIPRATRVGNSIIRSDVRVAKAKASHKLYEAIVELRKR